MAKMSRSRTRSAGTAARKRRTSTGSAADPAVTVRHYCQGIGDCHLLRFRKADGTFFHMLIDCGVHSAVSGGSKKIDDIVANIRGLTDRLDVIVGTHEHTDHLSGFASAAEIFGTFDVGEVWLGWTENPRDEQARALDKYKDHALAALTQTANTLEYKQGMSPHLATVRDGMQSLLGFELGVKGERVRRMREALEALANGKIRYLEPKTPPITIEGLPKLRIYVMGPPRDPALIKLVDRHGETYGMAGLGMSPVAHALANAFALDDGSLTVGDDSAAPFDGSEGVELSRLAAAPAEADEGEKQRLEALMAFYQEHYSGPVKVKHADKSKPDLTDQSWRRIDTDWLGIGADLAMQLDHKTNNTSLVLAFEFLDTRRVLLFVADAQVGNWLSWQDLTWRDGKRTVTTRDLLARTVFYKVGHHGSHNATLKAKGLELMTHPELSAFVPTNEKDAKKVRWGEMPQHDLIKELAKRTKGRLIRADDDWIAAPDAEGFATPSGSIKALRYEPGLWVEWDLDDPKK